jgi:hypothetical protein
MLELIHKNICGPLSIPSISKLRYFITFTNDYNRCTWIYFMKARSKDLNISKRFKQETKVEFGKQVKMFCFNWRREYNSKELEELLLWSWDKTSIYPSLDTSTKWSFRKEKWNNHGQAKNMLLKGNAPKSSWNEAISTANYLVNRLPIQLNQGMIPLQVFTSRKPNLRHLHIFGYKVHVHVP